MVFVIHWHESAMDLHVFPIPIPPPTSLSTRFLWVFPVHQARALVSWPCESHMKGIYNMGATVSPTEEFKRRFGECFASESLFEFFSWGNCCSHVVYSFHLRLTWSLLYPQRCGLRISVCCPGHFTSCLRHWQHLSVFTWGTPGHMDGPFLPRVALQMSPVHLWICLCPLEFPSGPALWHFL